jgi:hypothetical protein
MSEALRIDRLAAELAVEDRAIADGKSEQPAATEEVVTGTQREIVNCFKVRQRQSRHQVAKLTERLHALGDAIDPAEALGNLRDIPSRCENEILRLEADFRARLGFLGNRERQQREHYSSFRERNGLQRVAEYSRAPLLYYALVAVLLGACTLALGRLSAWGIEDSILDAPLPTLIISSVTALVPFALGATALRSVNHVLAGRRLLGRLVGGLCIAVIGVCALLVGHYLTALASAPEITLPSVVESALGDPAAVGADPGVWLGIGTVIVAGLLALLLGYRSDDAYPGYGKAQRDFDRARDRREGLVDRLRKRINGIIDEAGEDAARIVARIKADIRKHSRLLEELKRTPASLRAYDIALEDACNILLERYRAANAEVRQTQRPISFAEHVCFSAEQEEISSIADREERRLEALRQSLADLEGELGQIRRLLKELNGRAIREIGGLPEEVSAPG